MSDFKKEFKTNLTIFAISEAIILIYTVIHWHFWGREGVIGLSDTLFVVSTIFMCIGLLIAITNSSRRHYYKHLREKFKGKNPDDRRFEEDREKRVRFTAHGGAISVAGIFGIILCALIIYI